MSILTAGFRVVSPTGKHCGSITPEIAFNMLFYHSFPRSPNQGDHQYGLNVLDSILRIGLLITPEERKVAAYRNLPAAMYLQRRVCFTALESDKLADHARFFGEFAFEFNPDTLRELGALPAFYLTGTLQDGVLLHQAGENLLRLLLKAQEILWMVKGMQRDGTTEMKGLVDQSFPPRKENSNDAYLEEVPYALEALLNLYYPTDDYEHKLGHNLGYYKQREWKVIPNFASNGQWQYNDVPPEEKKALLALNPGYFSRVLRPGNKPRIDLCQCFRGFAGESLLNRVKRLIVPDAVLAEAQQKVATTPYKFPVVPLSQV